MLLSFHRSKLGYEGLLLESVYNAHEVSAFESCATDKATVDIRFGEELCSVRGLAAAAIENRGVFCYFSTIFAGDNAADPCVHVLGLLGSSGFAGADSPHGFVSKNDFTEIFGAEVEEAFFYLTTYNFVECAVFTL